MKRKIRAFCRSVPVGSPDPIRQNAGPGQGTLQAQNSLFVALVAVCSTTVILPDHLVELPAGVRHELNSEIV